jgi:hypothetical protein
MKAEPINVDKQPWKEPPIMWSAMPADDLDNHLARARNWGLVCGFGYGFAAATFALMILLFATAPGV